MPKTDKLPKRSRWIKFGALAVLPAIALTACTTQENPAPRDTETSATAEPAPTPQESEGQEPTGQASDEASPSGSAASEELAPPEYPKGINEFTEDNAIKFVEYYIELINYATQTGDTSDLSKYSSSDCEWCQEWIGEIGTIYGNGGEFRDFSIDTVVSPEVTHFQDNVVVSSVKMQAAPYSSRSGREQQWKDFEASTFSRDLATTWTSEEWSAVAFGVLDNKK